VNRRKFIKSIGATAWAFALAACAPLKPRHITEIPDYGCKPDSDRYECGVVQEYIGDYDPDVIAIYKPFDYGVGDHIRICDPYHGETMYIIEHDFDTYYQARRVS
jgi:hypothetical protein